MITRQRELEIEEWARKSWDEFDAQEAAKKRAANPPPGGFTRALNSYGQAYNDVYANNPLNPLNWAGTALGAAASIPAAAIGGVVGAVGTPIANYARNRKLFEGFGSNVYDTAINTGKLGYDVVKGGVLAAPFAAGAQIAPQVSPFATKLIGGEGLVASGLSVGSGVEDINRGKEAEGITKIALGGLGAAGSSLYLSRGLKEAGHIKQYGGQNTPQHRAVHEMEQYPEIHKEATRRYTRNPDHSYLDLADDIAEKTKNLHQSAKEIYGQAADQFEAANPGRTFDISQTVPQLKNTLNEAGLDLTPVRDELGRFSGNYEVTVAKGALHGAWNTKEINAVQTYVDNLGRNTQVSPRGLLQINDAFGALYEASDRGKYHSLLMQMNKATREATQQFLPADLKAANNLYSQYYDVYGDFLKNIVDAQDNLKPGAESFLSNLVKSNKGEMLRRAGDAGAVLGVNIRGQAKALQNVIMLSKIANKPASFFRSAMKTAVGLGVAGGIGGTIGVSYFRKLFDY